MADRTVFLGLLAACATPSSGCSSGAAAPDGEVLYREPHADGNTFACATCHALHEPAPDGLTRPGHPIGDAARRPSYKNGQLGSLLEAVNTCRVEWMAATQWTEDHPSWRALRDWLERQAEVQTAPSIQIQIVEPPADLSGGDEGRGRTIFDSRCIVCHGRGAAGTERAPRLAGLDLEPAYVARRVRTSGAESSPTYDGLTGGRMPFWGADRLSDDELLDVVAFVTDLEPFEVPDAGVGGDEGPDAGADAGGRECGSSHPKVGQVAELETRFHGVRGMARIVDDCTVLIEGFHYDASGIDVRIYGGSEGRYGAGFAMTGDLVQGEAYENSTLEARVPPGMSLADLDGISVWCVAVGVSFGDGMFHDP